VRLVVNPTLLLNAVAPVIAYQLLVRHGVGSTAALMYAAGFPLLAIAVAAVRNRRLDPIALLAFVAIAAGLAAGLVLHDGRILLVKDSIVTGVLGVVFLLSLPARRPMVFVLQRRLFSRGSGVELFDRSWADWQVRARSRRTTALWGVVLIAEATVRVALSFAVSPGTLLVISPLLTAVTFGPLALWTLRQRPKPAPTDSPASPAGANLGASHGPTSLRSR
jgi:intracellular septation protein A